ncbi:hypothetical protein [Glycomyces artemisiae]|uniref:Uncharacterized protein n=1 Tax=Glycomyces artemisiae TaxID=1076443 RepID=A0A2T0UEW3_9ACTN|nr:hypothetical protein [Glycomyces artemisiae]PRY56414.1 hypothetical protein B0I28_10963 [Glycomyces artemisiae]
MTDQLASPPPAAPPGAAPRPAPARPRGRFAAWVASWDWASHPPGWVVVNLASLLALTTWIGHRADLPWTVALIVGAVGAAAAAGAAMIAEDGPAVIWWRVACWLVPALWAVPALVWSPFQPFVLGAAVALAIAAYLIGKAIRLARRTAKAAALGLAAKRAGMTPEALKVAPADAVWKGEDPASTDEAALAANWEARIARVCRIKGVRVERVGIWRQGNGYTVIVKLPPGGTSAQDIARCAEGLAEDAQLASDCGVTVKPGHQGRRGYAEILVTHRNAMADTYPAPRDYTPVSIYDRAVLGILPDGAAIRIAFKWLWFVISGQTDAGKTSILHLILMWFGRCADTLPWVIDVGGGGGLARPWVRPWFEGRTKDPAVDWVATTDAEADLMCDVALAILKGRKRVYANDLDDGKIRCSPDLPHIAIVSDETATLPERVKSKLVAINQQGRASGVRGGTGVLRATAEDLPTAIKKHSRFRIGMRVSDRDEIRYLFDTPGKVDPALADWQGSGWVEHQDEDADGNPVGRKYLTPFKALFTPDAQIDEAAVAVGHFQPKLDAPSVALADSVSRTTRAYTDRWARTLPTLFLLDDAPAGPAPEADPERAARIAEAEADQARRHAEGGTITERLARLNELSQKITSGTEAEPTPEETPEVDLTQFTELTRGLEITFTDNLASVLAAVDAAGPDGTTPVKILEWVNHWREPGQQITAKTVQRKLGDLVESKAVIRTGRGTYVAAKTDTDQEGPTTDDR